MAHFVDFGETAELFRPSLKTIFNGFNLDDELTDENGSFMTLSVSGRNDSEYDITTHDVPGLDGVIEEGNPTLNPRIISVRFRIKADTSTQLQRKLEKLRSLLEGSKKELSFTDDEFFFYATNQSLEIPDEISNSLTSVITFLCSDPYKYGPEKTVIFPSDVVAYNYKGSAEAFPVYEMTVTAPITFAMIQNHLEESMLIGKPAEIDSQIVNEKDLIFNEFGESIDDWQSAPGFNGTFVRGSQGIQVANWGTGSGWHGPGAIKEIGPIQDFELEFFVYIRSENPAQTYRVSTNLYDENMNELAMMRVWDKYNNSQRKEVEARVGPYQGTFDDSIYLISRHNYDWRDQRVWAGIIKVTRKGNVFTFYAAHITQDGRHIQTITRKYTDLASLYDGKLKFIRIDIANFGNTAKPNEVAINRIRTFEHHQIQVDQTPYIAYPGDVITFDTQSEEMLINGEDAMEHKDFISEFFSLKKGENTIGVLPENALDVQMRFKERRI